MKTLVVFYSRTGTTRLTALKISHLLGADMMEIEDTINRSGFFGYLKSGRDAMRKRLTEIRPIARNLADYELIIVGTPVWGWTISTPIRTFLTNYKQEFKKLAFFCTMGGSGDIQSFAQMQNITGIVPLAKLGLLTKDVMQEKIDDKVESFASKLR